MNRTWIPVAHPVLDGNEKLYVNDCLDSSWISSAGKYIGRFEEEFAKYCSSDYGVACCNGTAALHLALLALGVSAEDEVLVPSLTFVSTANAVRYCGATPVFVDSEPQTMNINPADIEQRITARTKGIIVVHLYGHPADMDRIHNIAQQRNLFVVEDAAEAHGALYKGRKVGSLSDAATFSFYGNKIITTGEGGIITTGSRDLRDRMRLLRGQGMDPKRRYWFPVIGYNYRMTNIQAAIGLAQLERIEHHLECRKRIASWYAAALAPLADAVLSLPIEEPSASHAFWSYPVVLKEPAARDRLMAELADDGIETRPVFIPVHTMPPYSTGERLPIAERVAAGGISLPMHGLLSKEDVNYIASRIDQRTVHCRAAACQI